MGAKGLGASFPMVVWTDLDPNPYQLPHRLQKPAFNWPD
jgi:hypothetical protein